LTRCRVCDFMGAEELAALANSGDVGTEADAADGTF
jgi:hypothetical protein